MSKSINSQSKQRQIKAVRDAHYLLRASIPQRKRSEIDDDSSKRSTQRSKPLQSRPAIEEGTGTK